MALAIKTLCRKGFVYNVHNPVKWSAKRNFLFRILDRGSPRCNSNGSTYGIQHLSVIPYSIRQYSTQNKGNTGQQCPPESTSPCEDPNQPQDTEEKKQSLVQKFKFMYKNYWYVVLPVHLVTSGIWFGSCYYAVRSGVDVIAILQSIGVSESLIAPLRESSAGYVAFAFALYKLVTPLRYAVTVGGTTIAIKKLTAVGWIKPVPSKEQLKAMYQKKKDEYNESKIHYQIQMKETSSHVMDEMRRYKSEIRNIKNKIKKT